MYDTLKPVTYMSIIIKYITVFTAYYDTKYISLLHVIAFCNNNIAVSCAPLIHTHMYIYM
jgi:hypothetical protein